MNKENDPKLEEVVIPDFLVDVDDFSSDEFIDITVTNMANGKSSNTSCAFGDDVEYYVDNLKANLK